MTAITIICYKSGILAGDTATWSDNIFSGNMRKVIRTRTGYLVGAAGNCSTVQRFHRFIKDESATNDGPYNWEGGGDPFQALVISPRGRVTTYEENGATLDGLDSEFYAVGACSALAVGAMLAGASAIEAVHICIKNHMWAGGRVQSVKL